jgi:subtilisin family serine protease
LVQFGFSLSLNEFSLSESSAVQKISPELISLTEKTPFKTTKVLIQAENKQTLKEIALMAKNLGGKNIKEFKTGKIVVTEIPLEKLNEIALNSKVKFVFPDREVKATLNDAVPIVNAPTAWNYGFTGKGIKIAVLDTGIDSNHEMLQGKIVLEEDFSGTGNPSDVFGHGTHVAGIIAGTTSNGGTYNGIAPDALLLNGKVLNDFGVGSSSTVIAGINWAVNPDGNLLTDDGADIINLSLGANFSDVNSPINLAIRDAVEQGVVVVAAAGNCGESCPSMACGSFRGVGVPGDSFDAITVGATDKQNNWACFSAGGFIEGVGIKPDVVAPGVNINSSIPEGYGMKSGTSMSTPIVSGAIALMLEANPFMAPQEIKEWLELHSLDLGSAGKDSKFGSGLIDLTNINRIGFSDNNAPVFNSVSLPNNVLIGESVEITANVTDNESVIEVNAVIVNPLSEISLLNLTESNNDFWSTTFFDSNITGNYLVELKARDNEGFETTVNSSFNVTEFIPDNNSDSNFTGTETEFVVPEEIVKEIQGLISLNLVFLVSSEFALSVNPKDTTVEFYVRDLTGNIIEKEFVGPIEVPPNEQADFNYYWTSSVVNDYNIGAIVFSEGNQTEVNEKSTLVTVPENSAEITSFFITPTNIERGTIQEYLIEAKNNSLIPLNSFVELIFFDSNNNVAEILSSNKTIIDSNSSFVFDLNQRVMLKPENYEVKAVLHFEDQNHSSNPESITVFVPEIGFIDSIEFPSEVLVDENINLKINFGNTGSIELNPVFFAEITDGNETIEIINFGGEDVNSNSVKEFNANFNGIKKAGEYNLKILASYGNKEHEINVLKDFNVIDVQPPVLESISFDSEINENSPFLIQASFSDASDLNVIVSVNGTENPMNKVFSFGRDSNWNYTFFDTNTGTHSFFVTACDEFENCSTTSVYSFNVISLPASCNGNKVLAVEQEENFSQLLESNFCVTQWLPVNGSLTLEYLNRFNAVLWSEGNNINPIDENTSNTLMDFVSSGGKLLLEGQDIAFSHFDDNLMQFVVHATLFSDLILDENSNEKINITRKHPITLDFNELDLNFLNSSFPDTVIPTENAFSIADWNSGNSAIVLFNDFNESQAKVLFFSFSLNALNETEKTVLLNKSIEWLLENSSEDLSVNEILAPEFIIEGIPFDLNILLSNTGATIQPEIQIFSDNQLIESINSNENLITSQITLSKGIHKIKVFINPDFSFKEKFYLNNSLEKEIEVFPLEADLTVNSISTEISDEVLIQAEIENKGGTTALNALIEVFVDDTKIQEEFISFNPGETKTINAIANKNYGIHEIEVKVNDNNTIIEADYNNNNLIQELYVCSKNNILVVEDNDTENFSSDNPSSLNTITSILKGNGYCFEVWSEKMQGVPEISFLNEFNLVFWLSGDYWNTAIDENDMSLLEQYSGSIIFEGADIAFDHSGEEFLEQKMHATLDKDLIVSGQKALSLGTHRILNGISQITIDGNFSPYPDSLNPTDSVSVAEWPDANSAILVYDSNNLMVYFGFSIDAIIESDSREKLLVNSIEWIAESNSVCGDVTGDKQVNILDITFLVSYLLQGGQEPYPLWSANIDGVNGINMSDLTYLLDYLFRGGPEPICTVPQNNK